MDSPHANHAFLLLQSTTADAIDRLLRPAWSDEDVHTARKNLKKARAALRLLRPLLGDRAYRARNRELRDAGRCLSPLRDAQVMLGTLDVLAGDGGAATEHAAAIDGFRRAFAHRLAAAREEIAQPEAIQRCVELIETTRARVGRELPAAAAARETLEYGLSTQYRKARKAFRRARETQAAADLHEWRKQTKYLRAAQAAFGDMRGNGMAQRDRRAQRIGNWLGKDHDLAVLAELLGGRGQSEQPDASCPPGRISGVRRCGARRCARPKSCSPRNRVPTSRA